MVVFAIDQPLIWSITLNASNNAEFSLFSDYYKDFFVKLTETGNVAVSEYVYIYSLFLHFSCVLHADIGIQQICNSMVRKNQEVIEKFLDYVFKIGKCDRIIVQSAIEEAGKSICTLLLL